MIVKSWNVNGLRDDVVIHLKKLLKDNTIDILCIQETKRKKETIVKLLSDITNYEFIINSHTPSQYHGILTCVRKGIKHTEVKCVLNCDTRNDNKTNDPTVGRITTIKLEDHDIHLVHTYVPNAGKYHEYRIKQWDPALAEYLHKFRNVIWIGDINLAMNSIDVSHPSSMKTMAGFTQQERDSYQQLYDEKEWTDVWRYQHPDDKQYTWKNVKGMRLDNIIVSRTILNKVRTSDIEREWPAKSDHTIISMELVL
jgi:exodeoxyribonuclease-3